MRVESFKWFGLEMDERMMAGGSGTGGAGSDGPGGEGDLATEVRKKVSRPDKYKVLLYNDDFTPMEFVVMILEQVFGKGPAAATQIMLQIHRSGLGVAGVFLLEVAETKVNLVMDLARENQHPLQCTIEKDGGDNDDGET